MARQNRSVSIPEDLSTAIDEAAETAGITPSAWLVEAARRRLATEHGLAAMDEYFELAGQPSAEDEAWAEAAVERAVAFHQGSVTEVAS
jgi:hypothetical protein